MPQYDGELKINTVFYTKNVNSQIKTVENRIVKTADKVNLLKSKMAELGKTRIPTQEYAEIQAQICNANAELSKMIEKQIKLEETGRAKGSTWKTLKYDIEEAKNTIAYANGELKDLVDTGKAFKLGSGTEEYSKLGQDLKYAENEMQALCIKHDALIDRQNKVGTNGKKNFNKLDKAAKKTSGLMNTLISRFKGIALSLLVFNWISKGFNALVNGMKEGFKNLVQYSESYNKKVSELVTANDRLKNSLAAAFQPLVEKVIPYLVTFIDFLTEAVNKVNQMVALLSGKTTWTRAIKVQKDYADSLKDSADSSKKAEKAAEGYLSPIDEINKYKSPDGEEDKSSVSPKDMFEEVPIDQGLSTWMDSLKEKIRPLIEYAEELKAVFSDGFFDGLGDYQYRFDMLKEAIESIKNSLGTIWSDPKVLESADKWMKSLLYMLGSLVGTVASIGLSVATNLVSGIARYLEENKDRIKEHLISMFNIWSEINDLLSEGMQSVGYILESLASEQAISLTANLIGIAGEIIQGVTELASKLIRDALTILLQPIVDNKEAFKTAFEGLFGVMATVAGTIKDALAATFDKVNEVYDEHLKPFFDSVAQGVSDITGKFLAFLNETLIPALQRMAEKFDTLWKEHLQPLVDKAIEFIGKIVDLVKVLWEQYVQPFIEWLIENVLPVVIPILEEIWNTVCEVVGYIADAIGGLITVIGGIIDFLTGVFSGDWGKAWQGVADIQKGFSDMIGGFVKSMISFITGIVKTFVTAIKSMVSAFLNQLKATFNSFVTFIKRAIEGFKSFVTEGIQKMVSSAKKIWEDGWNSIADFFQSVWDRIVSIAQTVAGIITDIVSTIIGWISSAVSAIGNFKSTISSFSISGLISGKGGNEKAVTGYASGTVIPASHGEFLARVGDNNRETEVISPISVIRQAVHDEMGKSEKGGVSGGLHLTIQLERKAIYDEFMSEAKLRQMITGKNQFEY